MQADLRFCSLRLCNHVSLEKLHIGLLSQTFRSKGHALDPLTSRLPLTRTLRLRLPSMGRKSITSVGPVLVLRR